MGKQGNLAANAAALIMLGASGVDCAKYVMQAAAGCLGDERNRCNICNTGKCPRGITTQDPKLYRRLDPDKVAERVVDLFVAADKELKKIFAPLGRSTELPIGMSDGLSVDDKAVAERLQIATRARGRGGARRETRSGANPTATGRRRGGQEWLRSRAA